jgi:ADP-dependent NAD(P)H-hydrate dehydratase / NAD(P)H-hydrate epimerase
MISVSGMRKLEAAAVATGIDEALMMENAGANAAAILDSVIELQWKSVIVFCGTGNNCGDGLVFARHALISGATVTIYTVRRPEDLAPLPKKHYGVLLGLSSKGLPVSFVRRIQDAGEADILVDAMLGTGIRGQVSAEYRDAIKKFNAMGGTKVALDCPSGIDADTGKCLGACVAPDITITFHDAKAGLTRENSGRILVAGIGVPPLRE